MRKTLAPCEHKEFCRSSISTSLKNRCNVKIVTLFAPRRSPPCAQFGIRHNPARGSSARNRRTSYGFSNPEVPNDFL